MAIHYKPTKSREDKILTHTTVEKEDEVHLEKDWRRKLNMLSTYDSYQSTFIETHSEFDWMRDEKLGRIKVAVHRLELTPNGVHEIHPEPYRAGTKGQQFEKEEIYNKWRMMVIDLALK